MRGADARLRGPGLVASLAVAIVGAGLGILVAELWWPAGGDTRVASAALVSVTTPAPSATAASDLPPAPSASPAPVASPTPSFDLDAHSVDAADSLWVVVNKVRPIGPDDYAPDDLTTVAGVPGGATMRAEAATAMVALHEAAAAAGAGFSISTAFRDRDQQAGIYATYVNRSGTARADRYSARPGYSEHQTGLAADINADGCDLQQCFADTPAGRYVAEHAWEHGFIVRYPDGMEAVTGYMYEPWHLRYVGPELAAEMQETGVATMEQMFGLGAAPDYA